jgi:hypothetical protein
MNPPDVSEIILTYLQQSYCDGLRNEAHPEKLKKKISLQHLQRHRLFRNENGNFWLKEELKHGSSYKTDSIRADSESQPAVQ